MTNKDLTKAVDYCGVRSGRDVDKFKEMNLTAVQGEYIVAPYIKEAPVSIECKVTQILELGSHHMFIAKVEGVHVDKEYIDEKGKLDLNKSDLIVYSHGEYYDLNEKLGTFGYSVRKKAVLKEDNKKEVAKKKEKKNRLENSISKKKVEIKKETKYRKENSPYKRKHKQKNK